MLSFWPLFKPSPQPQSLKKVSKPGTIESSFGRNKPKKEKRMEMLRAQFALMAIFAFVLALIVPSITAQSPAPAPPPASDGVAVDQGVAYVLMLVALVLTYIIH